MWLPAVRETGAQLLQRALEFLGAVLSRPEQHIFIVSHGVFIETLQRCLLKVSTASSSNSVYFTAAFGFSAVPELLAISCASHCGNVLLSLRARMPTFTLYSQLTCTHIKY
jgi:Histidine phosphatase superfamily (branch 1)